MKVKLEEIIDAPFEIERNNVLYVGGKARLSPRVYSDGSTTVRENTNGTSRMWPKTDYFARVKARIVDASDNGSVMDVDLDIKKCLGLTPSKNMTTRLLKYFNQKLRSREIQHIEFDVYDLTKQPDYSTLRAYF